jgi:tocopherol O-methyltransferase
MTTADAAARAGATRREIRAFYDRLSPHFRDLWGPHLHDGYYRTGRESKEEAQDELVRHLAREGGLRRGAAVLDVGCGMGATAVMLAREHGCDVTGITLSPVQVGMARELAREAGVAARFELMDADEITLAERFDVLWMVGVLGHLPDQAAFVRRSPRLLEPGGRFVLGDWMLGEGVEPAEYEQHVEPVRRGMLMPAIHTLADTVGWFEAAGYRVLSARDLSAETARTWDLGVSIVRAPALLKLAASLGRDALELVRAIRGMRAAMRAGRVVYGQVVAERG